MKARSYVNNHMQTGGSEEERKAVSDETDDAGQVRAKDY